jgi:hypothetical protein
MGSVGMGAGVYVGPGTVGAMVAVGSIVGIEVGSGWEVLQADNNNTRLKKVIRNINAIGLFIYHSVCNF